MIIYTPYASAFEGPNDCVSVHAPNTRADRALHISVHQP